jgi:hypothetical protein
MVQVNFAADVANSGYDAYTPLYSPGIGLPTGRAMANGSTACLINALYGYAAGNGAARTINMILGSAGTANFAVGSSSSAAGTGWQAAGPWLVNGGTATFEYNTSGSIYFGRSSTSGGNNVQDGHGSGFTGTLSGWYQYVQSPPAMGAPTCSATGSSLTVTFSAPSDSGDGTISGYAIQYSLDPAFGTATTVSAASSPATITGVAPGNYYVRVTSSNEATNAEGSYAPWSASTTQRVGLGGARWSVSAGAEVPYTAFKRWSVSAGAEVTLTVAKRWDAVNGVEVDL